LNCKKALGEIQGLFITNSKLHLVKIDIFESLFRIAHLDSSCSTVTSA